MNQYAGAGWIQDQLDALHRSNPKKYPLVQMSPIGVRAADLLGEWQYGIYHLSNQHQLLFKTDWSNLHFIETSIYCESLSTYDFNDLTRLVFLAHDMAVRVQIEPSTRHYLKLLFHERTHGESNGKILHHHSLDQAVNLFKLERGK